MNGTGISKSIGYTPIDNYNGSDTFTIQISDETGNTDTLTVNVTIQPRNDVPINTVNPTISGVYHYGETLTINNGTWNDDTDLIPGTLNYTYQWQRADDNTGTNLVNIDTSQTYTLSISDNAKYIRAQITATDDGEGLPSTQSTTVNTAWTLVANTAPTFTESSPQAVTMDEDSSPLAFSLNLNANDSDGDTITWTIFSNATHGTATVNGTGTNKSIGYTPIDNYNGSDTFTIQISDGLGGTNTLTVNVTIQPRNDLPKNTVSPTISGIHHYGETLTINNGTWNDDTDINPGTLNYTYQWQRADDAMGTNTTNLDTNQSYTLALADNAKYIRAQIIATDDGEGLPSTQSTTVNTAWTLVTNTAPTFTESSPQAVTMDEDSSPLAFSLNLNASDSDGDTITWTIFSNATNGTATVNGTGTSKSIGYTQIDNYNGSDTFTIQISDEAGNTDTLTVNVTIQPRNDLPINTVSPTISGIHHYGETLTINNGAWNDDTDINPGILNYTYQWQRADDAMGTNRTNLDTNQSYTLALADNAKYIRAQIIATDDGEGLPSTQSTTVNTAWTLVTNTAPTFTESSPQAVTMDEDSSPLAFSLNLNASDSDGDTISWTIFSNATHGTATVNGTGTNKSIGYTPIDNYNGSDTFTIQISDGLGGTNTLTVNVSIQPRNDLPINTVGPTISGIHHYGETLTINNGAWNDDTDINPGTLNYTYQWQRADDAVGTNTTNIDTNQAYTLALADNTKYIRAQITATDDGEGLPSTQSTTINTDWTLIANTAPIFSDYSPVHVTMDEDAYPEAFKLTLYATDPDGDILSWHISSQANIGIAYVEGSGNQQAISYTPNLNDNGVDTFHVSVSDDIDQSASIQIIVNIQPVNDLPTASDFEVQGYENSEFFFSFNAFNMAFNDIDDQLLKRIKITQLPENGRLLINNTPVEINDTLFADQLTMLSFNPDQNWFGTTLFRFKTGDAASWSITAAEVTITMISTDSPPTVVNAISDVSLEINAADYIIPLTNVFNDPENDPISIEIYNNSNVDLVTAKISDNDLILSLQPDMEGSAEITIRATANEKSVDEIFSVYVNNTDVAPEILTHIENIVVFEDAPSTTIDLTPVFTDPNDDDQSIIKTIAYNTNESLVSTIISDNQLILSYSADANGTATIIVRGTSRGKSVDDTFMVTVTPVDDPPVIANAINDITVDEDASEKIIELYDVFTDRDNDDTAIQTTLADNSNISLVVATISENVLNLNFQPNESGTAEITLMGTSNDLTVEDKLIITVNPVDDPPVVANAIADVPMDISAVTLTIPLTNVFADIDNNNAEIIKTIQSNTNNDLVTVQITDYNLILTHKDNVEGESTVTVQAISNGIAINDSFNVYVNASDIAPVVQTPIADITVIEDSSSTHIDLATVFTDADTDDLLINKILVSNTNQALVTATITGNDLDLVYQPGAFGLSTITVRGTSQGKTVDDTFTVTVTPVDDDPIIANPLDDITVNEDAPETSIDISSVFTDPDNDDQAIIKTLISNDNESLLTATLTDNELILSYLPDAYGTATIVVRATSGGKIVDDSFVVTVNPVDDPPIIANEIIDISTDEDASDQIIDLTNVFTDKDNDNSDIQISIIENTNSSLVKSTISGNQLVLSYQSNENGTADITIRGTSSGLYIEDTFAVTVNPVDDPPFVANAIFDIALDINTETHEIDLTNVFADIDNSNIAKSILNNTNSDFVTAAITDNNLIISHQAGVEGETQITVQGLTNGIAVEDTFNVYAYESDIAPQIAASIEDITVVENAASTNIDLASVFTDPDNDDLSIAKMVFSNTNDTLVFASISGNNLTLDYQAGASGTAMITVRGTSRGKFVDDTFTVTVSSVDDPPVIVNTIQDIAVDEDASDTLIDLTPVFTDPDNNDQTIIKTIVSNSNESLVSCIITGNQLVLNYEPNASGSATLIIKASSGSKSVETSFNVVVTPVDDPPMIASAINAIMVNEDAAKQIIDLTGVFTDIDDYDTNIQLSITNNSNNNLVAASLSGYAMTLNYLPDQSGTAAITIRGTSNGLFVEDQLNITVNAVDDPPVVASAISDLSLGVNDGTYYIDLTNVFMDIDNNLIIKTIQSNTNSDLATASIVDNSIVISHQAGIEGETEITLQAISNGQMVSDSFKIFVDASDVAPEINAGLNDIITLEDSDNTIIDLSTVFTDSDNDDQNIDKLLVSNTNDSLVNATIDNNTLTLSYIPDAFGTSSITVRGTSQGKSIDDSFTVTVTPVDDPPMIQSPLNNIVVDENAFDSNISLLSVFTDADNDDSAINITVLQNTNDNLLTASLNENTLLLSYNENQYGEAIISIRGESNGLFIDDTFTVTVNAVDSAPEINNPIADIAVEMNAANMTIPLNNVFIDPDNDSISTAILSNTNESLVSATISGNDLILSFEANTEGTAIIKISGTANGKSVNDSFSVYVNSSDIGPEILTAINDITVLEDAPDTIINLATVFTDPDNDDLSIEKTILSNTNELLVSTAINNNQLILSFSADTSGTATIVIRGTSQGKTVDQSFKVTVAPVDDPPVIANAINDITVDEDASEQFIDLYDVFTDTDNDNTAIQTTLANNSNISLVVATISENVLNLNFQPNESGTAEIKLMGTSNGLTVEDKFIITVNPVDDPPFIANAIADVSMDISAVTLSIPLNNVFADIDNDNAAIIKTVQSNTNSNLITVQLSDNNLILTHQINVEGESTVTVQAISNGIVINDSFNVYVDASDIPPMIANSIEDITVTEGTESTTIDLTSIFTDPDDDDLLIEKTIQNNTNEQLLTVTIHGNQLILSYEPNVNGMAILTVRGTSKGKFINDSFNVIVAPKDSPPEIVNALNDVSLNEDADPLILSLSDVFNDVDSNNNDIIKTITYNTNDTLISATIADNELTINCMPDQHGRAVLSILAESDGLTIVDQMTIVVNPVDDPPQIASLISDINVDEDTEKSVIDLTNAFDDIDNDYILHGVQTNSNPSLVHTNIHNESLTLTYVADQNGHAVIVISGLSNGKTVTQAFNVYVAPVNDAPVAYDSHIYVMEDTPISAKIQVSDVDLDLLTINLESLPQHAVLTLSDQKFGHFIYTPHDDYEGMDSFSFTVSDNLLSSQMAYVNISITPVNDYPTISKVLDQKTFESTPISQISMNISDPDSKRLTITALSYDTKLLPLELISLSIGQSVHTYQISVAAESFDEPVFLNIKPAPREAGKAKVTLSIRDDRGAVIYQSFTVLVEKHTITAFSSGNGIIEPSGVLEVNTGEPFVFSIIPDDGYVIDQLIVDGTILSPRPTYIFWNVNESHEITPIFREPYNYTVTTLAGTGGKIEPDGNVLIQDGKSQTFNIQAHPGYEIDYLRVDNAYVAATEEYSFNNVKTSHSIEAFFKAVPTPIANFTASSVTGSSPLEVLFQDESQNIITSRLWDFGDGATSTSLNPKHTYFKPGTYSVTYTVYGPGGQDTHVKKDLIIIHDMYINFTATPSSGAFPLTSTFTPQLPDIVTEVIWNFGDGKTSSLFNPTHRYEMPGTYTVQLTAFVSENSATEVKTNYIKVKGRNISGRVTASDTGLGLAGYLVELVSRQKLKIGETYTDIDGYYSFVCEPLALTCNTNNQIPAATDLILAVWPPFRETDYYMQYYSGQSLEEKANLISTEDGDLKDINIILESTSDKRITGKVHDNGVPQAGIQVNTYSEKLSFGLSTLADEKGVYTLSGLKPSDDYCVYVWDAQRKTETYFALPDTQIPGQDIPTYSVFKWDSARHVEPSQPALTNIDILIDHEVNTRGTIQGQILTTENKAAQGIWVYAFSEIIGSGSGAFTDQNGAYTITSLTKVSDTDPYTMGYIVAVHSAQDNHQNNNTMLWYTYQAYPGVTDKTLAERVKTGSTHIDFVLRTDCSISGIVKDVYGSIIPAAEVQVRSDKTGVVVSAVTDQKGQYLISGLFPVDDYIITASAVYYPIMYYSGKSAQALADRVDLTDGDVTDINFALDTGYIIEGLVYIDNAETKASSGLWVNIWSESTRTGGDVPTDINGRYQITGLNPNVTDYFITIRKQGYMAAYHSDNNDSDLMNDTVYSIEDAIGISATPLELAVDRNLIIRTGLCVSGIVQYNAIPVSGIRVEAWSEATGGWDVDISKGTLTNGANYKISGLPPGEYHVNVYPLNYQDDFYRVELTNSDIQNLHFPLKDLKNMICGTLRGLENGKRAQISAWSEGTGFNKTIVLTGTGDDIPYTISQVKPSSDYRVQFSGFGYPLQVYNNHTSEDEADLINVTEDVVSGIDFVVYSGTKTISGTVTFPGSAVSGDIAWIDAFSQSTGSDGSAQIVLFDGNTANYLIKGLKEAPDFTVVAWGKQYQEQYYDQKTDSLKATYVNTSDNILDNHIDFDLTPGATISGSVFEQGLPVEGLHILALSDKTNSFGGATSLSDGSYIIDGLDLADDFVVKTQKSGTAPFYYHIISTTRDEKLATRVSTLDNLHPSGIDIQMDILESISGTIRDENGKSLSGIWVNVWSDLQKSGEGIYSSEDGTYMINALPKSNDYKVSIGEHAALIYVPEEKTNVKSGTSGVDFTLRRAYQLAGVVSNIEGKPIVKAEVELYSNIENFYVWTKTDGSGIYNIQCIPSAIDYALSIISPKLSSYVPYNEVGLSIVMETTTNNKIQKDIVLKTASFLSGYIYKADKTSPIMNAIISIYSNEQNFSAVGNTNEKGYYRINNIPNSNDYAVSVATENYEKTVKTDQVAGTSVDFILETGGSLSGKVLEQDGAPLADVLVEVKSLSAHFTGVQRTDVSGSFTVNGLPRFLDTGYEINDFVVTIYPKNYAEQSQGQKRVGETVTFVCKQAKITGSITDSNGSPIPDGVVVAVKIYKNVSHGGFITKTGVESDGTFIIEGLLHDTNYQLEIRIFNSKISGNIQWVDQNKNGVVGRTNAGVFMAGSSVEVRLSGSWDD